jgi:hypothetical protein
MWPFKRKQDVDQRIVVPSIEELTRRRRSFYEWWITLPTFMQALAALLASSLAIYGAWKAATVRGSKTDVTLPANPKASAPVQSDEKPPH